MPVTTGRFNNVKRAAIESLEQAIGLLKTMEMDTETRHSLKTAGDLAQQAAKDIFILNGIVDERYS